MNRFRRVVHWLVLAAVLLAGFPLDTFAKSYSSGGGKSYSSSRGSSGGSRSSSSSGSRSSGSSSRSSSNSRSSSSGSKSFGSSGGKSYSSGSSQNNSSKSYSSGKSYNATPRWSFSSDKKSGDSGSQSSKLTFDNAAARAEKEESSQKAFTARKESQIPKPPANVGEAPTSPPGQPARDYNRPASRRTVYVPEREVLLTRPARMSTVFRPYYSRPVVVYNDPFGGFFWWWLLDQSLENRAQWAYHHRHTMDSTRYQALVEHDAELEARVRQLEAEKVATNPNFVPAGVDRDLMYSDRYVQRAYSNRPTTTGRVAFWMLTTVAVAGTGFFLVWLVFFKRWQVST
jgi:hypothetical protein